MLRTGHCLRKRRSSLPTNGTNGTNGRALINEKVRHLRYIPAKQSKGKTCPHSQPITDLTARIFLADITDIVDQNVVGPIWQIACVSLWHLTLLRLLWRHLCLTRTLRVGPCLLDPSPWYRLPILAVLRWLPLPRMTWSKTHSVPLAVGLSFTCRQVVLVRIVKNLAIP